MTGQHKDRLSDAAKTLLPHSTWHAVVLMSWVPHLRQFEVSSSVSGPTDASVSAHDILVDCTPAMINPHDIGSRATQQSPRARSTST